MVGASEVATAGVHRRKLIEVALPLDVLNRESAREKSIRHGHPSTLHLWWSRKPLAAARAVLFAQLVDDPASRPDLFPTSEAQDGERARLLDLVGRLCSWAATADSALMAEARQEITRALAGDDVTFWDPFAGGGSLPLEGQRLGLPVVSSDLNPVAVLLQRAMLEMPRRWRGRLPVGTGGDERLLEGAGGAPDPDRAAGLAADVREFGDQVLAAAARRLRPLYPEVRWDGGSYPVAAYLWVRTVPCGNPACTAIVPMLSNPWLRRKAGQEAWLRPSWDGRQLRFEVMSGPGASTRTSRGAVFTCPACGTPTTADDVKGIARETGLGRALRCVVPDSPSPRPFLVIPQADVNPDAELDPDAELHRDADPDPDPDTDTDTDTDFDTDVGLGLNLDPRVTNAPTYGLTTIADLHLPRQRTALCIFAAAVAAITPKVERAARAAGWPPAEAASYARDVTVLLGLVLGRLSNRMSTACIWNAHLGLVEQTFIQNNAIAFPWDFAEANPLCTASGSWASQLDWVARVIERCDPAAEARAVQQDARQPPAELTGRSVVISTDPPYFDYFVYSSLSDYFYVWLRQALREVEPALFATIATPRQAEIVMGDAAGSSREDFLAGLTEAMTTIARTASPQYPVTIYYAYKSTAGGRAGVSAWQAFLAAVKAAELTITATWPIRTERTEGIKTGTNSLASSIVVVCRRRSESATRIDRRRFVAELRARIPETVRRLQDSGISPVDLEQAAIGPGLSVFTSYPDVIDADGTPLGVDVALAEVNRMIAESIAQQDADLDAESRFCLAWFEEYGFEPGPFGRADGLASVKNTSVRQLERAGLLLARGGVVRLNVPSAEPAGAGLGHGVGGAGLGAGGTGYGTGGVERLAVWRVTFQLAGWLQEGGPKAAGALMATVADRVDLHACRELAYLVYGSCARKNLPQVAALFNALGASWSDIEPAAGGLSG